MHPTDSLNTHRHTAALVFDIPEVAASAPMASTTSECCAGLGIDFTRIDAWEVARAGVGMAQTLVVA